MRPQTVGTADPYSDTSIQVLPLGQIRYYGNQLRMGCLRMGYIHPFHPLLCTWWGGALHNANDLPVYTRESAIEHLKKKSAENRKAAANTSSQESDGGKLWFGRSAMRNVSRAAAKVRAAR